MADEIKVVRIHRFDEGNNLKAFVDIAIGDFIVKGLKIVAGKKGLFLSMPQEKSKDGRYFNAFYPLTKQARQKLTEVALSAYEE